MTCHVSTILRAKGYPHEFRMKVAVYQGGYSWEVTTEKDGALLATGLACCAGHAAERARRSVREVTASMKCMQDRMEAET